MKKFTFTFIVLLSFVSSGLRAQIENVIVEPWYISDSIDATDTIGGHVAPGSFTYRIYIDLAPGSRLKKIYGDTTHVFRISSTACFFNNIADGQTFASNFPKNRLQENTVALDTWLTLGQTTKTAVKTNFGVLKTQDDDGSFIGGANNDGGSAAVPSGLLTNNNGEAGIPITIADGMDTMTTVPTSWGDYGIVDFITGDDSTIFGSLKPDSQFVCYNCGLQNSGVMGVNPDSNQVIIAQLTTTGLISFELNAEVEVPAQPNPIIVKYVAHLAPGEVNSDTVKQCAYLSYPPSCGCTNAMFVEYSSAYACSNPDSCHTLVRFGCRDTAACNYDPSANFHLQNLCCYPGLCNDRDLSLVCPSVLFERNGIAHFGLYPNPAKENISLAFFLQEEQPVEYSIYNATGQLILEKNMQIVSGSINEEIDLHSFENGLYLLRINSKENSSTRIFVKN